MTAAVEVALDAHHVATIELRRPPNNFFSMELLLGIAEALESLDAGDCRAVVLCAEGKHFCAGADFGREGDEGWTTEGHTWWEVGTPEVSEHEKVRAAHAEIEGARARQRRGV